MRYGASSVRYIWPAECDLARLAGLELEARYADWDRSPFTSDSEGLVSVWRKPWRLARQSPMTERATSPSPTITTSTAAAAGRWRMPRSSRPEP